MHIHCAYIARVIIAPHCIEQMIAAVHLVRIQRHQLQQIEFLRCQVDLPSGDIQSPALTVQMEFPRSTTLRSSFSGVFFLVRRMIALIRAFTSRILNGFVM